MQTQFTNKDETKESVDTPLV